MKVRLILYTLLFIVFILTDLSAQTLPLVYNVENTGANCPVPILPSFSELPLVTPLPDPFEWADGRGRMSNYSDWRIRRTEIGAQVQNYEIGTKPAVDSSQVTASYSGGTTAGSSGTLTVDVTANGYTLILTCPVSIPSGATAPYPVCIGMDSPYGSLTSSIFTSRGIVGVTFSESQVSTYGSPSNSNPYYRLYPNFNVDNTGQYSAWAWGVSRVIDGLELVQNTLPIDLKHIAVTGCSYAGKLALFAGAFDERMALTLAMESGGGGATSWRYSHSLPAGSVEDIDNTDYNWFMNSMQQFASDSVSKLPEDHHELMAMVAPRALYVTANPDYIWLSNPSCFVVSNACLQVYKALGIPDRFGYSIVGGHSHCAVPSNQIPEISAFVDKFLLGKDTTNTSNVADSGGYTIDLSPWITWTNPALSNDTTFFAALSYPPNSQVGLDTSITFKWNKIGKAQKYLIQVSTDPSFKTINKSDSTTTDTLKIFSGLLKDQKYYWRVQVRTSPAIGPWSSIWSFVTTLTPPSVPQFVSAASSQNGYNTFSWRKVKDAAQYLVQISTVPSFASIFKSAAVSDTSKTLSWFSEGQEYYWRVQANNIAGSSPWCSVLKFAVIYAPTGLTAQKSAANEITLTWNNNSAVEDGNVIEREESPDTSFTLLDTLKGTGSEYSDKTVEQGQTYSYRVSAYNDSLESSYSNEASLLLSVNRIGGMPTEYSLSQNYPNPFNPTTKIKFALLQRAQTRMVIYDLLGREIQTLVNRELEAGYYEITVDAASLPSGVYFYRIRSGDFVQTKKMILMK